MTTTKNLLLKNCLPSYYRSRAIKLLDSAFVQADVTLECLGGILNRKISAVQFSLFLQNQKMHGVDISRFCGADEHDKV